MGNLALRGRYVLYRQAGGYELGTSVCLTGWAGAGQHGWCKGDQLATKGGTSYDHVCLFDQLD